MTYLLFIVILSAWMWRFALTHSLTQCVHQRVKLKKKGEGQRRRRAMESEEGASSMVANVTNGRPIRGAGRPDGSPCLWIATHTRIHAHTGHQVHVTDEMWKRFAMHARTAPVSTYSIWGEARLGASSRPRRLHRKLCVQYRTDGRTDGQNNRTLPDPLRPVTIYHDRTDSNCRGDKTTRCTDPITATILSSNNQSLMFSTSWNQGIHKLATIV